MRPSPATRLAPGLTSQLCRTHCFSNSQEGRSQVTSGQIIPFLQPLLTDSPPPWKPPFTRAQVV